MTIGTALLRIMCRLRNRHHVVASIYLTAADTDDLLAEAGQTRDRRCTRRPAVERFNGVPVYPDRPFSAVFYSDGDQMHHEPL